MTTDFGLLVLRVGVGASMFFLHGWGKLSGGPATWERIGGAMAQFGITFTPLAWGFLAAFAESIGAALLVVGLFFRPAALMLAFTMFVAVTRHLGIPEGEPGAGWSGASHAVKLFFVFSALFFTGPGRFAIRGR